MKQKKISVIIPTFNRGWCIQRAIKSVIKQPYKNWELIIVDDGSADNTKKVVKKYLKDRRIKYYKLSKNKGVNFARNKGLDISSGEHIVLLDSDDEFLPGAFDAIVNEFATISNDQIGMLLFNCVDQDNQIVGKGAENGSVLTYEDWISGKKFSGEKIGVVTRSVVKDGFRFADSKGQLEGIFWYKAARKYKTKFVNKPIRIYHTEHNDRLTGTGQLVRKAKYQSHIYEILLEEFETDFRNLNPKGLAKIYLEKGINEIVNKEAGKGRSSLNRALKYRKDKILLVLFVFILSYLPNRMFISLAKLGHRYKGVLN